MVGQADTEDLESQLNELVDSVLSTCCGEAGWNAARMRDPPPELLHEVRREWYRRCALAPGERADVPLHLALSETRSDVEAVAHQRTIELHPRCISSFGTLADTALERERAWPAIARRGVARSGSFTFLAPDFAPPTEAVTTLVERWVSEGRVERDEVAARARAIQAHQGATREAEPETVARCRVRTTDRADHGKVRMALKELCPMDPGPLRVASGRAGDQAEADDRPAQD